MKPADFVKKYYLYAVNDLGFNPWITLTQAALESGWGDHAPGFMFFGIKDTDGINGNEQLISTTEISKKLNATPKEVGLESITKVEPYSMNGQKYFIYYGKGYFRKYVSPKESFDDHIKFFIKNSRYEKALMVKDKPEEFFKAIAAAGYATAPDYAQSLIDTYRAIKKYEPA